MAIITNISTNTYYDYRQYDDRIEYTITVISRGRDDSPFNTRLGPDLIPDLIGKEVKIIEASSYNTSNTLAGQNNIPITDIKEHSSLSKRKFINSISELSLKDELET